MPDICKSQCVYVDLDSRPEVVSQLGIIRIDGIHHTGSIEPDVQMPEQSMLAAISIAQAHCQELAMTQGYCMYEMDVSPQQPMRLLLRGIKLGAASFHRLIALTTVLGFISLLPTIYMAGEFGDAQISPDSMLLLFRQGHFILTVLLLQLFVLVMGLIVNALVIQRIDQAARGTQKINELSLVMRKIWPLILAGILCVITLLVGLMVAALIGAIAGIVIGIIFGHAAAIVVTEACIFAALIYISIYILFFQFAIILDGKGPVGALNYSSALVFRNWWRTFLVLLYTTLIIIGILIMVALPLSLVLPLEHWLPVTPLADTGRTLLIKGVTKFIITAVFAPFIAGILYVLYHDLKTRYTVKTTPAGVVQA